MTWNFNIDDAPRGKYKTVSFVKEGKLISREVFQPENVITASKCGRVIVSQWLDEEKRWSMYGVNELPIAWQDYPRHPNEITGVK